MLLSDVDATLPMLSIKTHALPVCRSFTDMRADFRASMIKPAPQRRALAAASLVAEVSVFQDKISASESVCRNPFGCEMAVWHLLELHALYDEYKKDKLHERRPLMAETRAEGSVE